MKLVVVFALLVLAIRARNVDSSEQPRVLCGRILADARVFYCYSSDGQKRSPAAPLIVSSQPGHGLSVVWPWLARRIYQQQLEQQQARAQARALRGKRDPGLVDECCLKPCYVSELLDYC